MTKKARAGAPVEAHPMHLWIVTLRYPPGTSHDPHRKITSICPASVCCTDATGAHHSQVIAAPSVEHVREHFAGAHITRIELCQKNAHMTSQHELAAAYRKHNALQWIAHIAHQHWFGDAFDPEHMRALMTIAADALDGTRDLPDYEASMEKARRKALKKAARFSEEMAGD